MSLQLSEGWNHYCQGQL
jgi:hypothetical protein